MKTYNLSKKFFSIVIVIVMLFCVLPLDYVRSESAAIHIIHNGKSVSEIDLPIDRKTTLYTSENNADAYQWQIYIPDSSQWVDIYDKTSSSCEISYNLIGKFTDVNNKSEIRCKTTANNRSYFSNSIKIRVTEIPAESYIHTEYNAPTMHAAMKLDKPIPDGENGRNNVYVSHGDPVSYASTIIREGYNFVGWFYINEETNEKTAFLPNNMPVNKDIKIYAEWVADKMIRYTIHYIGANALKDADGTYLLSNGKYVLDMENAIRIADDTTGQLQDGRTKTFSAKALPELWDEYNTDYFPELASHAIMFSEDTHETDPSVTVTKVNMDGSPYILEKDDVTVTNTNEFDVSVRAMVIASWQDADGNTLAATPSEGTDYTITYGDDWELRSDGFYYYKSILGKNESTTPLLTDCKPIKKAPSSGYTLNINIVSQTVQTINDNGEFPY